MAPHDPSAAHSRPAPDVAPAPPRVALASVDNAWLRMDDPTNLMVVTGVLMFDDRLSMRQLHDLVRSRLLRVPRFTQCVVEDALGATWVPAPEFSLDDHLVSATLPAGDDHQAALQAFCAELMTRPFDPGKPRWQFHLVEHYGHGSALVLRVHHCIGDGLALIYVLLSMSDDGPTPPRVERPDDATDEPVSGWAALGRTLGTAAAAVVQVPVALVRGVAAAVSDPSRLVDAGALVASGAGALSKLLLMGPDPPSPFKGPLVVDKRVAWSSAFDVAVFKQIGTVTGCTINDVLMAALAGALRRYLLDLQREVPSTFAIRGVVPVNLRAFEKAHELGNQFGLVFLELPLGLDEPLDRLFAVRARMQAIKRSPEAMLVYQLLRFAGTAPRTIFDGLIDLFSTKATTVVTNVMGPRERITFAGARMSQGMFWVPSAGRLGMGVSLLSYAGQVWLGLQTDAELVPAPARLLEHFSEEVDALVALASEPTQTATRGAGVPPRR
ncbi:MAG: wax ester/triacylglycerol synthase family O-acyltransferase [Acidobacteria bacterium]|nr:wax ester/triacylglycerol synthase family O-acyltransferase [Acidobacteriota bacterium]